MIDVGASIQRALDHGIATHELDDVAEILARGDAQLWVEPGACIVTEVVQEPRAKVLNFWLASGDMDPVLELHERILAWGRDQGCTLATFTGRKGWTKALAHLGWRPFAVSMSREL